MIAGLSKSITLYLAPLLYLTAILLSLFAFLSPAVMLHDQVALVTVTTTVPSTGSHPSKAPDGPSLFLGPLGSCSKKNNAATIKCTVPSISPTYDISFLPSAVSSLLSAPTTFTNVTIAMALILSVIFFISFNLISFRHKMGKAGAFLERRLVQTSSAWIGVISFFIGLMAFLVLRMWLGKAVNDFNASIQTIDSIGPQLAANIGNAFTMAWVAYSFNAVPVIISLAKLNVLATKSA